MSFDSLHRVFLAREASLSESETALAWIVAENEQLTESAKKERAKLEAECQAARESERKAREESEGNTPAQSYPSCWGSLVV